MQLPPSAIVAALMKLGLYPSQAEQAARDERITWTEEVLAACVTYVRRSTANTPEAVLWSQFLQHGRTPPALKVAAPPPPDVPNCPVCRAPLDQCAGLHGWAAAYRTHSQPSDIAEVGT